MAGEKVGDFVYLIGGYLNSRDLDEPLSEVWRFNLDSLKEWEAPCSRVLISQEAFTLEVDDTKTLFCSVLPSYAADTKVSWSSSDEAVASVSSAGVVTAVSKGLATITATANGGGCAASCELTVTTVGVQYSLTTHLSLFPNPTSDLLTIQTNDPGIHQLEITSLNGQSVYNGEMEGSSHQLDLSSFQKGVYIVTISSKDFVTTEKIIKL